VMSNHHVSVAVRTRFNLWPSPTAPCTCVCKKEHLIDTHSGPSHLSWCPKARSRGTTLRHNTVVDALASLARLAGVQPYVEPRELPRPPADGVNKKKESRPDIIMYGTDGTRLVDVSVLHPLSPTYIGKWRDDNVEGEQAIISTREKRKVKQHEELAQRMVLEERESERKVVEVDAPVPYPSVVVAAFVVDVFGAFGQQAEELLRWLATAAVGNHAASSETAFIKMAAAVLATALQRGNGLLISNMLPRQRAWINARRAGRAAAVGLLAAAAVDAGVPRAAAAAEAAAAAARSSHPARQ